MPIVELLICDGCGTENRGDDGWRKWNIYSYAHQHNNDTINIDTINRTAISWSVLPVTCPDCSDQLRKAIGQMLPMSLEDNAFTTDIT